MREREKERERQTEREKQRQRQRERQTDRGRGDRGRGGGGGERFINALNLSYGCGPLTGDWWSTYHGIRAALSTVNVILDKKLGPPLISYYQDLPGTSKQGLPGAMPPNTRVHKGIYSIALNRQLCHDFNCSICNRNTRARVAIVSNSISQRDS